MQGYETLLNKDAPQKLETLMRHVFSWDYKTLKGNIIAYQISF